MQFFLVFLVFPVFAQDITVEVSKEMNESKFRFADHLLSKNNEHYVYFTSPVKLFSGSMDLYLKKYDGSFKEVYSKELKVNKKNIYSRGIQHFGDQFVWFQYENDRKGKKHKYYITPIGLDGKAGKPKKIATFNKKKGFLKKAGHDSSWKISNDKSKLLFYAEQVGTKKDDSYQIYVSIYDKKLDKMWDKKIKMPYVQSKLIINDIEFGTDNSIYIIAQVYTEKSRKNRLFKSNKKVDYNMSIFKISENEDIAEYKLDLKNKFIKNIALADDQSRSELVLIGLIGETRRGAITGVTNMRMDKKSGKILLAKSRKFSEKEIESFGKKSTTRSGKNKERGLENAFVMRNIVFNSDGGMTVSAEQYYVTYTTDKNGNVSRSYFHNNHIIVIEIDPDGELDYVKMIPRKINRSASGAAIAKNLQKATHIMFYEPFIHNGTIYYLYNDNKKNFERKISDPDKYKTLKNSRESITVLSHFDDKDRLVKKRIFKTDDLNSLIAPKFCEQISPNEMFFFAYKGSLLKANKIRLGVIRIND